MPYELLEEIRLLVNIESHTEKLLPLVLAGQPELATRLNEPELRQLKQRIDLRCMLAPLSLQESATYISFRIQRAGGDPGRMFSREAVLAIHEHACGIPRTISVICDNALLNGFALQRRQVDADLIVETCRDFDLPGRGLGPSSSLAKDVEFLDAGPTVRPSVRVGIRAWPNAARRFSRGMVWSR